MTKQLKAYLQIFSKGTILFSNFSFVPKNRYARINKQKVYFKDVCWPVIIYISLESSVNYNNYRMIAITCNNFLSCAYLVKCICGRCTSSLSVQDRLQSAVGSVQGLLNSSNLPVRTASDPDHPDAAGYVACSFAMFLRLDGWYTE